MRWVRGIVGILFALIGLVWIGQGTTLISSRSVMTGQIQWVIVGVVILVLGGWLLWGAVRVPARDQARRG